MMPSHSHATTPALTAARPASSAAGTSDNPAGNVAATADISVRGGSATTGNIYAPASAADAALATETVTGTVDVADTGGGQAHENRQPFQGINYIICLFGVFPSRN